MLKLIPEERPDSSRRKKTTGTGVKPVLKLQQKKQQEIRTENGLIQAVSVKLTRFIKNTHKATEEDMSDLIHSLQRTVLSLQRLRTKIQRANPKKKKK